MSSDAPTFSGGGNKPPPPPPGPGDFQYDWGQYLKTQEELKGTRGRQNTIFSQNFGSKLSDSGLFGSSLMGL